MLREIFNTLNGRNKVAVFLKLCERDFTHYELEKELNLNKSPLHHSINKLIEEGVVIKTKISKPKNLRLGRPRTSGKYAKYINKYSLSKKGEKFKERLM